MKVGLWPVGLTVKFCVTEEAAAYVLLSPGCEATIVQVLAETKVTVVPLTVHTAVVVEVRLTGRLELAVAVSVSGVPTTWVPGLLKVMSCVASGGRILSVTRGGYGYRRVVGAGACVASITMVPETTKR